MVFPAQAGVFLSSPLQEPPEPCIPRPGGGVSSLGKFGRMKVMYSPPRRGCFSSSIDKILSIVVFPAQAGVFLVKAIPYG
jgi:hypothetical protein